MKNGLEQFLKHSHKKYKNLRLGIVCNQASVDKKLRHITELVTEKSLGLNVTAFFGPQHGIRGEKQDNMIESEDFIDARTGLPVFSLYGYTRTPDEKMMSHVDALVVDLQGVGTRIYTFMYTMANCMIAAAKEGKKVIVLDRPNPIGGEVEGNLLEPKYTSFVGQYPMSTRHGMTMGELAWMFNHEYKIHCELDIVPLKNWDRKNYLDEYQKHWIFPSPNIPTLDSAITFPGTVHFEGTNISEGRGTTRPLEWVGAPFINPDKLAKEMNKLELPGVFFRSMFFQPTYQKWMGEVCGGVQIHVLNRKKFKPVDAGLRLLHKIATMYPKDFQWKMPPYEYENERMPIDLIVGSAKFREDIENKKTYTGFAKLCESGAEKFKNIRKNYLLY